MSAFTPMFGQNGVNENGKGWKLVEVVATRE